MKNKILYIVSGIFVLVLLFITSYLLINWHHSGKWSLESDPNEEILAINSDQKEIKDDIVIIKDNNGALEKEKVSDFKIKYNIKGALNKKILNEKLTEEGYEYRTEDENKIYYTINNKETKLEENKYYLGEYDGKLAILKGDENGNPKLESKEDLTSKSVNDLKEQDQKNIRNFTKQYESKEEAEEEITDYIS